MPEPTLKDDPKAPLLGMRTRIGLPLLAGILVLALGSAYFLQKDRYQRAAQRAEFTAAAEGAAREINARLDQTKTASALLGALLHRRDAESFAASAALLASRHPFVDAWELTDAEGQRLWRSSPDSAGQRLNFARGSPVTAVGEPLFVRLGNRIRYAQALHAGNQYAGDAIAEISLQSLADSLPGINSLRARTALTAPSTNDEKTAPFVGESVGSSALTVSVGPPGAGLTLALEPSQGWHGSPFLPFELGLCAVAAVLSTVFGYLVLSHPRRPQPSPTAIPASGAAAEHLLEVALDATPSPGCLQDPAGHYVAVNTAFERFTGHDRETLRQWGEVAAQPGDLFEALARRPFLTTTQARSADGQYRTISISRVTLDQPETLRGFSLALVNDRSELQKAAQRVAQVTRSFAVLSGVSAAIVGTRDSKTLLERCCELLVERGEFPLAFAWRRGASGSELATVRGTEPELAAQAIGCLASCPANCDAAAEDVFVCVDEQCRNAELFSALSGAGIRSLAVLPLLTRERMGIGLASRERHAFSADETELLRELAATLRHALSSLAMESARHEAEERLRLAARVFENSSEGIIITDSHNRILMVNRTFVQVTGYSSEEVIGRNPSLLSSGQQSPNFYREMWATIERRGEWHGEVQNRRKNGELYAEWLTISVVKDDAGKITNFVAVFTDITSKKQIAERLNFLANYDTLTALPNRILFTDRLKQAINAARQSGRHVAVLALDLDRFSLVNETFGHAAGDRLLREIASRLHASVRDGDSVSRVGGDEFSIVLPDLESPDEATVVAGKIMQALATPLLHDGQEIFATASIGVGVFPDDGDDSDSLVRNANSAMYRAMEEGRNTFRFYHQEMNARSSERMSLQSELRRALERGELVMHYQPFIDSKSGRIVGAEALLRWHRPGVGFVTPASFIPLLEETGQIVPVGDWVLASALEDCQRWHAHGHRELFVAVNFSALQLADSEVTRRVGDAISRLGANPRHLEIELTESAVMRDPDRGIRTLNGFREIGTRLSIDDFGTGYSSLAYIKKLPIDTLKIDRSFVADTPGENEANAIVQAIVAMGHNLDLKIIAEGVQEKGQVDFLRQLRCDLLQGFYFATALPQSEFVSLLTACAVGDAEWMKEPWQASPARMLSQVGKN